MTYVRTGGRYYVTEPSIVITAVDPADDRSTLRSLLEEFHEWLDVHAPSYDPEAGITEDFRSLDRESESWAWVARSDGTPAGCVLLYGETDDLAEFKRLWVRPAHRGDGIGRALTRTVVDEAHDRGYERLGLTTPPWSEAAQTLYESMGFERTTAYPETRLPEKYHDDAIFMQLDLTTVGRDKNR